MARGKASVLLVAEEAAAELRDFRPPGIDWRVAGDMQSASREAETGVFDAVLVDLECAMSREALLAWTRDQGSGAPVIALGPALADLERAAIAAGAVTYLTSPIDAAALGHVLGSLAKARNEEPEAADLGGELGLLGDSPHMQRVRDTVAQVAAGTSTVLIRGETGTGKELVARAVQTASARRTAPFVKVHAAALPDALLESELFGYEKGAFTGAHARKAGRVELAEGGTLFFDEIGEVSPAMQTKLLRLLQDREYERLGGTRTLRADIRFIAATHRDLEQMVASGAFREDLFYRLNVVTVWLPPLRARRSDIPIIAKHHLQRFRETNGKPDLVVDDEALRLLQAQRWPGNVRQLVNFVERTVVLSEGKRVTAADVRRDLDEQIAFLTQAASQDSVAIPPEPVVAPVALESKLVPVAPTTSGTSSAVLPLREEMRRTERRALVRALERVKGNRVQAARLLGISRRTLYTKLEEHGIL